MTAKYANGFEAMAGDRVRRVAFGQPRVPIDSERIVEKIIGWMIVVDCGAWDARNFNLIARADGSGPGEVREVNIAASALIYAANIETETNFAAMGLTAVGFDKAKESADAAARDRLTGEWYAAEVERVAKERDEARESLRNAMDRIAELEKMQGDSQ